MIGFVFIVIIAILVICLLRMRIRQQMLSRIVELTEKRKEVKGANDDDEPGPSSRPYMGDDDSNEYGNSNITSKQGMMMQ
jgi:hypothetical protein